jgi:hypothetical protein
MYPDRDDEITAEMERLDIRAVELRDSFPEMTWRERIVYAALLKQDAETYHGGSCTDMPMRAIAVSRLLKTDF